MNKVAHVAILPVLIAALLCSLIALAVQHNELADLRVHMPRSHEYRAEVVRMLVSDPEYLSRLEAQNKPVASVTVTAYNATPAQCDADPEIAASMRRVKPGTIAVSRDLFNKGWVFGKKVRLEGLGIFEINDLMAARHSKAIDIYLAGDNAMSFGKRHAKAALLSI
jgi:3D (Asp-Asp-Asp) domain-containing protein